MESERSSVTAPTGSKEKWLVHAQRKLGQGYVLIVSNDRRNANFHHPEKGYEMCSYQVARQLIKDELVVKTRDHHLGSVFELSEEGHSAATVARRTPLPRDDHDDETVSEAPEVEAMLDEMDDALDTEDLDDEDELEPSEIFADGETWWVLSGDLAERFGLDTNYQAEERVADAVRTEMPEIAGRLEFDTEADAFCVRSTRADDLQIVRSVINALSDPSKAS
jgi:hypothetical protein